jgi:hypothetical protein
MLSMTGKHEAELYLRMSITANVAIGIEVLCGFQSGLHAGEPYIVIVRWNGAAGDYTTIYDAGFNSVPGLTNGTVIRAEMVNQLVNVYQDGTPIATNIDATAGGTLSPIASGQPGLGFWPVDGATPESYGWSSYRAGNL